MMFGLGFHLIHDPTCPAKEIADGALRWALHTMR
jgi:hypothetical protein